VRHDRCSLVGMHLLLEGFSPDSIVHPVAVSDPAGARFRLEVQPTCAFILMCQR
jgi:hypothetical protein